jgi:hypothetical protein
MNRPAKAIEWKCTGEFSWMRNFTVFSYDFLLNFRNFSTNPLIIFFPWWTFFYFHFHNFFLWISKGKEVKNFPYLNTNENVLGVLMRKDFYPRHKNKKILNKKERVIGTWKFFIAKMWKVENFPLGIFQEFLRWATERRMKKFSNFIFLSIWR